MMYIVTVDFRIHREKVSAFLEAIKAQAKSSLERENACLQFDVCTAPNDPGRVFLYEVYVDEPAFQAHLETTHFAQFNASTTDWVESKQVATWRRISGTSP